MAADDTLAEVQAYHAAFVAARGGGNYDEAIFQLEVLQARLDSLPDLRRELDGGGSQSITWRPSQIPQLITECRRDKAVAGVASGGMFRTSKLVPTRATI